VASSTPYGFLVNSFVTYRVSAGVLGDWPKSEWKEIDAIAKTNQAYLICEYYLENSLNYKPSENMFAFWYGDINPVAKEIYENTPSEHVLNSIGYARRKCPLTYEEVLRTRTYLPKEKALYRSEVENELGVELLVLSTGYLSHISKMKDDKEYRSKFVNKFRTEDKVLYLAGLQYLDAYQAMHPHGGIPFPEGVVDQKDQLDYFAKKLISNPEKYLTYIYEVNKSRVEKIKIDLQRQSKLGDKHALYRLALLLITPSILPPDYVEGEKLLKHAAENGHVKAMSKLGILSLLKGERKNSIHWLKKAADSGDLEASYFIWHTNFINKDGVLSAKEATKYLKRSADGGYPRAQFQYGRMLLEKNATVKAGAAYIKQAAAQGMAEAQLELAGLYSTGRGVAKKEYDAQDIYYSLERSPNLAVRDLALTLARALAEKRELEYQNKKKWDSKDKYIIFGGLALLAIGISQSLTNTNGQSQSQTNTKKGGNAFCDSLRQSLPLHGGTISDWAVASTFGCSPF
jgi:TPR repeat protein